VHEFPTGSKHTLNEFEISLPNRPSAPPSHSELKHCSPQKRGVDHPAQDPNCDGQVLGATHAFGLIALAIASGSADSAAASMAGVGGITASLLGAAISSTASACPWSGLPGCATVHAPTAHTIINLSALRTIQILPYR
jgi:hypothetical protein